MTDLSKPPCQEWLLSEAMLKLGELYLCEGNWRDLKPIAINSIVKYATEEHTRIKELEAEIADSDSLGERQASLIVKIEGYRQIERERIKDLEAERDRLKDQAYRLIQERDRLRDALPDPDRLIQLATWLDLKYPNEGNEVQEDLRRWGYGIKDALEETT